MMPTEFVYELIASGYNLSTGVRTLSLHKSLDGAKTAYRWVDSDGNLRLVWTEEDGAWFADIPEHAVTLVIQKRPLFN